MPAVQDYFLPVRLTIRFE